MLTAKGGTDDKVRSLSVRRRRLPRQAVRLRRAHRALARQAAPAAADRRERPALARRLDQSRRRAKRGAASDRLEFTQREFDLLEVFMREPRRVFSKDHLLEIVWGHDFEGGPNIVETYISYLRAKIDRPRRTWLVHPHGSWRWLRPLAIAGSRGDAKQNSCVPSLRAYTRRCSASRSFIVILASSIALVVELYSLHRRHRGRQARRSAHSGRSLPARRHDARAGRAGNRHAAFSGIGLRVTVFDEKGRYLAGDKTLRPKVLDRILRWEEWSISFRARAAHGIRRQSGRPDTGHELRRCTLAPVHGGYVAFAPSHARCCSSRSCRTGVSFWRSRSSPCSVSWFIGRLFAGAGACSRSTKSAESLRALAGGDYTQRRFIMESGDEVASLTEAYNDAAASVAIAMDERRRAEERMRQFAADAAHELRTPLTVIGGYIDVLRRGAVEEPKIARQILATMSIEKEHMRGLIDRLMRLARMDAETQPAVEEIDVAELLARSGAMRRAAWTTAALDRLQRRRRAKRSRPIAAKSAKRSGTSSRTRSSTRPTRPFTSRRPEQRSHRHQRARRRTRHVRIRAAARFRAILSRRQRGEITGTGLGLAIAKRAVERAGGEIAIDSAPGHGTAVIITL